MSIRYWLTFSALVVLIVFASHYDHQNFADDSHRVAYATLIDGEAYVESARVLLCSLLRVNAVSQERPFLVLVPPWFENSSHQVYRWPCTRVVRANTRECRAPPEARDRAEETKRDRFSRTTWCKRALWRETGWDRLIYLDADTVVLSQKVRELETLPTRLPAFVPDFMSPDRPNGGVIVLRPDRSKYLDLLANTDVRIADGSDQDLWAHHFTSDWYGSTAMLPTRYNMAAWAHVGHPFLVDLDRVVVMHYAGENKPWLQSRAGRPLQSQWRDVMRPWLALRNECRRTIPQ